MIGRLLAVLALYVLSGGRLSASAEELSASDAARAIIRMEACRVAWNYHVSNNASLPQSKFNLPEPIPRLKTADGISGIEYSYALTLPGEANVCGGFFIPHASDSSVDSGTITDPASKLANVVSDTIETIVYSETKSEFRTSVSNILFMIDGSSGAARTPNTFNQDLAKATAEFTTLLASRISAAGLPIDPSSAVGQMRILPADPQPNSRPSGFWLWITGLPDQQVWDIRQLVEADMARWERIAFVNFPSALPPETSTAAPPSNSGVWWTFLLLPLAGIGYWVFASKIRAPIPTTDYKGPRDIFDDPKPREHDIFDED